jgi:hypothetical protein
MKSLNRLAKWRSVFAGWQLGTRPLTDPECQAVRDHRELSLILRAEVSTLVHLLVKKGVFTTEEFTTALGDEADMMDADLQRRFPGMSSTEEGMKFDARAHETMKGWKP